MSQNNSAQMAGSLAGPKPCTPMHTNVEHFCYSSLLIDAEEYMLLVSGN